jgi:hypothetical protein
MSALVSADDRRTAALSAWLSDSFWVVCRARSAYHRHTQASEHFTHSRHMSCPLLAICSLADGGCPHP